MSFDRKWAAQQLYEIAVCCSNEGLENPELSERARMNLTYVKLQEPINLLKGEMTRDLAELL